jgi:hypothetical protein
VKSAGAIAQIVELEMSGVSGILGDGTKGNVPVAQPGA